MKTFFESTPIYYVNDVPHPGHAYTTVAADALARARRLLGHDVFFLTGTDEHGQNIEKIAAEKGIPPQEYTDRIAQRFKDLWARLDIRYDGFIRTTDALHERGVLALWKRLKQAETPAGPAVYRGKYEGWYCPRCEAFYDEEELKEPGHLCPDHERPCEWTEEENFFFRLSAYSAMLQDVIERGARGEPGGLHIEPLGRRNEVLAVIRQGLRDFSISRARVKWGIPVPDEPGHVFYVWTDALENYVTALGFSETGAARAPYEKYWEKADERLHFVGKEIIRFHCLYWPAMLHAAGLPLPTRVFAHGWLTKGGKKLSKTTGNVIDPDALIDRYGADAFRYFFLREGSFGQDWDFTEDAFVRRFNSDLANDLGNLVSRVLAMAWKYAGGRVPPATAATGFDATTIFERYEALDFAGALEAAWAEVAKLNQRIVRSAPWEMAKDPGREQDLSRLLYELLETVRRLAAVISPIMPTASRRIYAMLGQDRDPAPGDLGSGVLTPGAPLGEMAPLFPRIETASKETTVSETKPPAPTPATPPAETTQTAPPTSTQIDIAEFGRLDLKVGQVKEAEKIPGSKKLIKLQVDIGGEVRQVVAGIAEAYAPEALVGKKIVLVANLKPAKLMGVESNGMVLAASVDGKPILCTFESDVPPGAKVK